MVKESGYKPKLPTMNSPKSEPITPPMLISGPFESSQGYRGPHPTQAESEEWYDDEETSVYHSDYAVPPYAGSPTSQVIHAGVQLGPQVLQPVHQRQPFPHSMSSPHVIGSPQSTPTLPLSPVSDMSQHFNRPSRHMKTRSMVIPVDLQRRESTSDSHDGLGIVVESSISTLGKKTGSLRVSVPAFENQDIPTARPRATSNASPMVPTHRHHARQRSMTRPSSTLHPYVRTFTSPIDLVDLEVPADLPTRTV
ncbi:hypothetical protein BDW22DRAFT_1373579 [Trametopsis cervina]|nr:hypothetical protein BDW22DRAFT_1373579 [Trametopsis cervina]